MTNNRNQKVIDALKAYLIESGYTEDRYGNYLNSEKTRRYKFNAISYRIEQKFRKGGKWYKIGGYYYKDVSMVNGEII